MSYDVIETLVPKKMKELEQASLIQLEGETQFKRYLPLEQPKAVTPYFESLKHFVKNFNRCAERIQTDFIYCGYYLNEIKKRCLYCYCVDTGLQGYTNFFKFCEDRLGISKTSAQRLVLINDRFCGGTPTLPERLYKYGASKLAILATFENGLEGKVPPQTSCRDLEKLRKYYVSHGWEVSRDTTWQTDLETYVQEEAERRRQKRAYLTQPFESVKTEAAAQREKTPKKIFVYTKFLDQTISRLKGILPPEGDVFEEVMQRVYDALKAAQTDLLYRQSGDMLDGL